MTTAQLKETPLAKDHRQLGARMVDFAGWNMPVQYKSIITEHMAVRTKVGLFDVSHMGEFLIGGSGAPDVIQYLIANDLSRLKKPNCALYTQMLYAHGGTVDDLIVYRRQSDFLLVVNASNCEKDWRWVKEQARSFENVDLQNISQETALLALQGPNAVDVLAGLVGDWVRNLNSFDYATATVDGVEISFGRTGYTGEDGFEIFMPNAKAEKLWNLLLARGQKFGIEPCGLGARDTLRLEAGLPLYGHELDENISPLEAGLGWSVKLDKDNFSGKDALLAQKTIGLSKQLICLKAQGKALPRAGYPIMNGEQEIGSVASGSQGIFVGYPVATAFVPPAYSKIGQQLFIGIRDNPVPAQVVSRPFYKRAGN